jgi:hypothetical protein
MQEIEKTQQSHVDVGLGAIADGTDSLVSRLIEKAQALVPEPFFKFN